MNANVKPRRSRGAALAAALAALLLITASCGSGTDSNSASAASGASAQSSSSAASAGSAESAQSAASRQSAGGSASSTATSQDVSAPNKSSSSRELTHKIGFAFPDTTIDVYKPLIQGAQETAKKLGYQILQTPGANPNATRQIASLNTWISTGVDAIVVQPVDLSSLKPIVEKAHAAGIKIIGYATKIPGEDGFIKWSDSQGGKIIGAAAAKWVNSTLSGKANVGILEDAELQVSRDRLDPAIAELQAKAPGAKVVARAKAVNATDALTVASTMLQAHPDIKVILCFTDANEVGAARALVQARIDVKSVWLGGFDGSLQALQMIKDGKMHGATAALPLKDIGSGIAQYAYNAISGTGSATHTYEYELASNETPDLVNRLISDYGSGK